MDFVSRPSSPRNSDVLKGRLLATSCTTCPSCGNPPGVRTRLERRKTLQLGWLQTFFNEAPAVIARRPSDASPRYIYHRAAVWTLIRSKTNSSGHTGRQWQLWLRVRIVGSTSRGVWRSRGSGASHLLVLAAGRRGAIVPRLRFLATACHPTYSIAALPRVCIYVRIRCSRRHRGSPSYVYITGRISCRSSNRTSRTINIQG